MDIDQLIQIMRLCSLAKVRAELEAMQNHRILTQERKKEFDVIVRFYQRAVVRNSDATQYQLCPNCGSTVRKK